MALLIQKLLWQLNNMVVLIVLITVCIKNAEVNQNKKEYVNNAGTHEQAVKSAVDEMKTALVIRETKGY